MTRVAGAVTTSMGPKLASTDVVVLPVLVPLEHKQYKVVQMSGEQAAAYAARIRDAFQLVKGQGHFPMVPNKQGASHAAMQGVRSLVNALTATRRRLIRTCDPCGTARGIRHPF